MDIPDMLLVHSCQVEPYQGTQGDGAERFGAAFTVPRCFVDGKRQLVRGNANGGDGDAQVSSTQVYAPLSLDPDTVPLGSRVTTSTGARGKVLAVQRYDGGALPVPSHVLISLGEAA